MTRLVRPTRALAVAATALALALLLAACGSDDSTGTDGSAASTGGTSASPTGAPAAGPHNDADVIFAMMMVPHHAQAVEMAGLVLDKEGIDPAVVELAERIKAAQGPEIEQMRGWLAGWDAPVPAADGDLDGTGGMAGMDHGTGSMPGMMSDTDVTRLEDTTGSEATDLFLEQMTRHHRGAIVMATTELGSGESSDAKALAQDIIDAQRAEIATMTELSGG